jgi:hypothetical protein
MRDATRATKALLSTTGTEALSMYDAYLYQVVWYNIFTIDGAPFQDDLQAGRLPLEEWQALFYQREEPGYGGKRDAVEPWSQIGLAVAPDTQDVLGPATYASEEEWRAANDYECWPGLSRVRRARDLVSTLRTLNKRSQTTKSVTGGRGGGQRERTPL